MLRALIRTVLTLLVVWGVASGGARAVGPSKTTPPTVLAYADSGYRGRVLEIKVFEGDFSGDGKIDAVAFIYFALVGGNSFGIDVSLFEGRDDGLVRTRAAADVYGTDPRDVTIAPGVIEVTTTTLKSGDARCCPTGETRHSIKP